MSKIQWTDHTINPLVGCTKISDGCKNCYAAKASKTGRLRQFPQYHGVVTANGEWTGLINFAPEQLDKLFKFKKPTRVFMPSMSDPFHPRVKDEWLDQIFAAIALNPQVTVQMLTKRPRRMQSYIENLTICQIRQGAEKAGYPLPPIFGIGKTTLPNLWLGVSVENQAAADERIPLLSETPAAVRFLSCEPLLENVDLGLMGSTVDWVIVGGESGSSARICDLGWVRSICNQCDVFGIPVFIKQLGSNPVGSRSFADPSGNEAVWKESLVFCDLKGGDIEEWPKDLQIRVMPK